MKIQKKHIIAFAIGTLTITGALTYLEYMKIVDYAIKFKRLKIKKITPKEIDFDIFLFYTNKSKLGFDILTQKYDLYINNVFVTTLINKAPTHIKPNSVSDLGLNIAFNPEETLKSINQTFASVLANPDRILFKIVSSLRIKLGPFKFNIPYVYEATLKEMMA